MASQIPLALPKTMLPSPEGALSAGVSSQWVRILPNNVSQVVSAESVAIVQTDQAVTPIVLGSQPIQFEIPTGQPLTFCDVAKSTISFRARYEVSTASTANYTGVKAFLQSSAHSYFQRIATYVAGNLVDDVVGLDVAMAEETAYGFNVTERDVNWNQGFLAEQPAANSLNSLQGHSIATWTDATAMPVGSEFMSYEIPLMSSLFGKNAKSMCPVHKLGKSQIVLTTPQTAPVLVFNSTANTGASAKLRITLDQFAINLFYVTLDDRSASLLGGLGGETYLHSITHRVGSGSIGASTSGSVSVQVPIRVKSARALSTRFNESEIATAGSLNGQFDAKMPVASSMNYFIASKQRIPPNPHNLTIAPAVAFSRSLMANFADSYEPWKARSGLVPNTYLKYVKLGAAIAGADSYDYRLITAGSATTFNTLSNFSFAEDLRVTSTSTFLAGQDLTMSNSFLELNLAKANSNALNVTFIAKADIIYVIMPDGSVEYRV
jgi:hypothetical protein